MVIEIHTSPVQYQDSLMKADSDKRANFNGIIDSYPEASIAAVDYCMKNQPDECQKFLVYLEKSGFALFPSYLNGLDSHPWETRARSAKTLAALIQANIPTERKKEVVSELITKLKKGDVYSRRGAANALSLIAKTNISIQLKQNIARQLIDCLALSEDGEVRRYCTKASTYLSESNIGEKLKEEMTIALIGVLSDSDEINADAATQALACLAKTDISPDNKAVMVEPLIKAIPRFTCITDGLIKAFAKLIESNLHLGLKKNTIETLMNNFLTSMNGVVMWNSHNILVRLFESKIPLEIKDGMVNICVTHLGSEKYPISDRVVWLLISFVGSKVPSERSIKVLDEVFKALRSKNEIIRRNAIEILNLLAMSEIRAELKEKMVLPLIGASRDKNASVSVNARTALSFLLESEISEDSKAKIRSAI